MSTRASRGRRDTASRLVQAAPDVVYRAFADARSLMAWLAPEGMTGTPFEYEFHEGGRYRIELRYEDKSGSGKSTDRTDVSRGQFIELVPGRRIKQSVEFESDDPAFAGTMTMTWTFAPSANGGTLVNIAADDVPSGIKAEDHQAGLNSSLEHLARLLERR